MARKSFNRSDPTRRQRQLAERVAQAFRQAGAMPPPVKVLSQQVGAPPSAVRAMIGVLLAEGTLIQLGEEIFFHKDTLQELAKLVRQTMRERGSLRVGEFRDLTGSSRKFVVPVLEYFDRIGLTRRTGDVRVLNE